VLSAAVALGVAWIVAAVVAQLPSALSLRADIQRSLILRQLNEILPPSGPILNALARLDPLPSIAASTPDVAPPVPAIARTPAVRAASRGVVRVVGSACGLGIEGSGWVEAAGMVVTNAHVVAGERDTQVEVAGGGALSAQAVAFDPTDDVAVLRVPGLSVPPLRFAQRAVAGTPGAILGYPENGPFTAVPARIGSTRRALADNAYGEGPVTRLLTSLRGRVRPGNSGGPVVDAEGDVLTTVFASTTGSRVPGGFGVANPTVAAVIARASSPVGTGACAPG
jgi:S1-C subfamily serine protease